MNLDGVMGIFGVEIHFKVERDADPAFHASFGALVEAAGLSFFDHEEFGFDMMTGNDGIAGLSDFVEVPAEGVGDQSQRVLQTCMAGVPGAETAAKFGWRQ